MTFFLWTNSSELEVFKDFTLEATQNPHIMTNKGTGAVKFEAPSSIDALWKNGVSSEISVRLHCISCMREYEDKSLEELRLEDYLAIRKGPPQMSGGLFGSHRNDIFGPFDIFSTGNRNPFGSTEDSSPFVKPGLFTLVNNFPFGNTNTFGSTGSKPAFGNTSMFGSSTESKPPFGNTSVFGSSTESKPPFGNTSMFGSSTESKPPFGNTSMFGSSTESKPPFGNTSVFGSSTESKPPFGNTSMFGSSTESKPPFGNTSVFGSSTESKPPFGNTSMFGSSTESKPPFGNTSVFGSSTESKPPFGNTSMFGSSTESKPPFGNTSVFGSSTESKPSFGNTSMFGFTVNKPNFGNTSTFNSPGSNPVFGNANIFGFAKSKPCFGNTNTFTAVAQTQPETQSPTSKSISSPNKLQNKPTFGIEAPLFNLSSKTTSSLSSSSTSSTCRPKQIRTSSKSRNFRVRPETVEVLSSTTKESSDIAQEGVQFAGIEKFNFNLRNSKPSGPHGEFILQNLASENHEEGIKKLVSDLQGLIECPVCFGSLDFSLKQCEQGHGICGSCFNNVDKCPTCQLPYLPCKPILLWQILDRLPKPCSFSDKGCDKICLNQKEEHETFCKFRPTSCKFQSCEWKGTVETVTDHVRICKKSTEYDLCEIHFPNVKITQMYKFDKTQDVSLFSAVIFENQLFWKYFHRDSSSKIISYKFYHVPQYKPKQKYYLVVSFNKGEIEFKTSVAASFETERHSEDKKGNEISFFLPDEDLERFYDVEAKGYTYTQQIIAEDICDKKKPM